MCRKKCFFVLAIAALLVSCSTKQKMETATLPEYEFRQLDTMVVTAPKKLPGENAPEEAYELPVYHASH